jgi:hypothetical protein
VISQPTEKAWAIRGASDLAGGKLELWEQTHPAAQWLPVAKSDGSYQFVARHSNKCLDAPTNQLVQADCNAGNYQAFRFIAQ